MPRLRITIVGLIAAGIAALGWGLLVAATQKEFFLAALGVGLIVGVSVALAAGKHAGTQTGVIALIIALLGVLAGKYTAVELLMN